MRQNDSPFLSIQIGSKFLFEGEYYAITSFLNIETALGQNIISGETKRLRIAELRPLNDKSDDNHSDGIFSSSSTIPDEDWSLAMKRFEIIRPLLITGNDRSRKAVEERAKLYDVSASTLYRWISTYQSTNLVSSLVKQKRSDKGGSRIPAETEKLITHCIELLYLTPQRLSVSRVCESIIQKCKQNKLTPPHPNTIRNRIALLREEYKLSRRYGRKEAAQKFAPIEGSFPGADYPLSVVQIDHTPLDVIVVDEATRHPIGRPWITLAFDVYSRMVCGFYIGMERPSTMSVSLCLAHSILPKERWLANRNISFSWPLWGVPDSIHADNAKEFHAKVLQRSCSEYNVIINWRPVAVPNYGGHIERMLGTLAKAIHEVPGTTFSNTKERGSYNSNAKAILTLKELDTWIAIYVIGNYHQKVHSGISMTPLAKYEQGILGHENVLGRGLPPRIIDEARVLLDFLPYTERTIQDYGVAFNTIHYYSNVLRPWINATDPQNSKLKRKFIFRYDPRDLSQLFFLDPELNVYYSIPYRNTAHPAISIWEIREARKYALENQNTQIDEDIIFSAYERLRSIEQTATKLTKKARRSAQQRIDTTDRTDYLPQAPKTPPMPMEIPASNITIEAFDDIDEEI